MDNEIQTIHSKLKEIYDILGGYIERMKPKKVEKYLNLMPLTLANDMIVFDRENCRYATDDEEEWLLRVSDNNHDKDYRSFQLNWRYNWEIEYTNQFYPRLVPTRKDAKDE